MSETTLSESNLSETKLSDSNSADRRASHSSDKAIAMALILAAGFLALLASLPTA